MIFIRFFEFYSYLLVAAGWGAHTRILKSSADCTFSQGQSAPGAAPVLAQVTQTAFICVPGKTGKEVARLNEIFHAARNDSPRRSLLFHGASEPSFSWAPGSRPVWRCSGQRPASYQPRGNALSLPSHLILLQVNGLPHSPQTLVHSLRVVAGISPRARNHQVVSSGFWRTTSLRRQNPPPFPVERSVVPGAYEPEVLGSVTHLRCPHGSATEAERA